MADLLQPVPVSPAGARVRAWVTAARQSARLRPVLAAAGAVVAAAVLVAIGLAFLRSASPPPRLTLPRAEPGSAPPGDPVAAPVAAGPAQPGAASSTMPVTVTVHVAGQVASPGVYAIPAGGRVADAIVAAGGPSPDADADQLNLAAHVADGERIYVPKRGEPTPPAIGGGAGSAGPAAPAGPLDLNTATAEQLEALPGVGPATSKAILTYRAGHGRFRSVTELLEVPGIGPAKLEALRPLVKV